MSELISVNVILTSATSVNKKRCSSTYVSKKLTMALLFQQAAFHQRRIEDSSSGGSGGCSPKNFWTTPLKLLQMWVNTILKNLFNVFGQILRIIFLKNGGSGPPFPPFGIPLLTPNKSNITAPCFLTKGELQCSKIRQCYIAFLPTMYLS